MNYEESVEAPICPYCGIKDYFLSNGEGFYRETCGTCHKEFTVNCELHFYTETIEEYECKHKKGTIPENGLLKCAECGEIIKEWPQPSLVDYIKDNTI